ncbi:MAG: LptE family protein [Paludibacter sp.]|nr:LptE family protein [Paludibacter sp.]
MTRKNILKTCDFNLLVVLVVTLILSSCTISYKFNGSMVDYSKTKTISISDFPNSAELIYPPLAQEFTETLRDAYTKQTRLQVLKKGGDMHLEGEIVGYQLTPMAISADTYSAETKLTLTVNVRFYNNKNPVDDFENKKYTAFQTFNSSRMLTEVQDELMKTMVADIVDNIYNDTVGKW